jgi:hypothetical protein
VPEDPLKDFADQFSASFREDRDLELVLSAARQRALDVIAKRLRGRAGLAIPCR